MEIQINNATWLLVAFNILLAIAGFFGAKWLSRMERDMNDMRKVQSEAATHSAERELQFQRELQGYAGKADLTELRRELNTNFQRLFEGMQDMRDRIAAKADR